MGLGRWALARLLDAMHGDWQERRVTSPPLSIVADADAIAIRMLEGLGFVRAAALYQLQVGGNEMMEPRYPESMPRIKVGAHATSAAYIPRWPQRSVYNQFMDAPILMSPLMRYHYRLEHDADKGRRGQALLSMLASPVLRGELLSRIRDFSPPPLHLPHSTPASADNTSAPAERASGGGHMHPQVCLALKLCGQVTLASQQQQQQQQQRAGEEEEEEEEDDARRSPYHIEDWKAFANSSERVLAMAYACANSYSLPEQDREDPVALQIQRWRRSVWGDGKTVTAAYYSPWKHLENRTGTYLRKEWIEEWMEHHRHFCDAAPKLCNTREDDAQVGFRL